MAEAGRHPCASGNPGTVDSGRHDAEGVSAPKHCQPQLWFSCPTDVQLRPKGLTGLRAPLPSLVIRWFGDLFAWASSEAGGLLEGSHKQPAALPA